MFTRLWYPMSESTCCHREEQYICVHACKYFHENYPAGTPMVSAVRLRTEGRCFMACMCEKSSTVVKSHEQFSSNPATLVYPRNHRRPNPRGLCRSSFLLCSSLSHFVLAEPLLYTRNIDTQVDRPRFCFVFFVLPLSCLVCSLRVFCFGPFSQAHLRNVFYRMGFDDEGIVALSGAHTVGRAFKVMFFLCFFRNNRSASCA